MAFMILATGLYINAWYVVPWTSFAHTLTILRSAKGEECIPQTWDIYHEKWGFMVIFWNFAGAYISFKMILIRSRLLQVSHLCVTTIQRYLHCTHSDH